MNQSSNKQAVIVGIFIILGLGFLAAGILVVGNLHSTFHRKTTLVTLFDDVSGLQTGNNIWISGVKVGTVSNLEFHGRSKVIVTMDIATDSRKYIRKDAKVKISSDGLIGNRILVIYGGTDSAPEAQAGDTLHVEKTFTSDDVINTAQENNKNLLAITNDLKVITSRLVSGQGSVGKLLQDSLMYTNINQTIQSLQKASVKAQQMLNTLADFSAGINKKGTLAKDLITDTVMYKSMKATMSDLQLTADSAALLIGNLKRISNDPNSPIGVLLHDKEAGAQLKESLEYLNSSSKKLDENLEAAKHNILFKRYFKKKAKGKVE
jgi:phospholipid/cholesterol/gamma-HCH transport system substrate-binding protein